MEIEISKDNITEIIVACWDKADRMRDIAKRAESLELKMKTLERASKLDKIASDFERLLIKREGR